MIYSRKDIDQMVYLAYLEARKNERNKQSQLEFELHLENNLRNLREALFTRTYKPSPAFCFIVTHPSKREVFAPAFVDRVVSHVLYRILAPLFEPLFIVDSYSCRKNKGTLYGIERFEHHLRSCTNNFTKKAYVLNLDISGYFMGIEKNILRKEILDKMDSKRDKWESLMDYDFISWLLDVIIFKDPLKGCIRLGKSSDWIGLPAHKSLFSILEGKGLPIGDLTSLLFSNIYLNVLDLYAKLVLKCKHYCRYVDDIRIIDTNKERLEEISNEIDKFLSEHLHISLNLDKTKIISSFKRLEFLGAVILTHKRYATKRTLKNFAQKVRYMEYDPEVRAIFASLNSYLGYFIHFRADKVKKRTLDLSSLLKYFDFGKYNKVKYKL